MLRMLQPHIAALVRPMPDDFSMNFEDHGRYVRWIDTLMVEGHGPVEVEIGYSRATGKGDETTERANLYAGAWQAIELARLGRIDLLEFCRVDRHNRARPVNKPLIMVVPESKTPV